MTDTETCRICGRDDELRTMETACQRHGSRSLTVCEACLDRRAAKRWDATTSKGRRLVDALTRRSPEHPQGRYSYLVDTEEVSLVRLQHGWLETHAAPA